MTAHSRQLFPVWLRICRESKHTKDFQSIEDMANFIDNLSDYSHNQGVTYKHVTLMSELSRIVEQRLLMQVGADMWDPSVLCEWNDMHRPCNRAPMRKSSYQTAGYTTCFS